jgi:hypothetical protein
MDPARTKATGQGRLVVACADEIGRCCILPPFRHGAANDNDNDEIT